jgi:hypothetical protein
MSDSGKGLRRVGSFGRKAVEPTKLTDVAESCKPSSMWKPDNPPRTTAREPQYYFDGFSILWAPGSDGSADCDVAVRFNFLSTDFSHHKGVKGIPNRLYVKTEVVSTGSLHSSQGVPETCFCRVKLYRDHGAERKLSSDVAHVKKTIDKLQQQITQTETGLNVNGKRNRSWSIATKFTPSGTLDNFPKCKRTRSMSSASFAERRVIAKEDLHFMLQTMQDMLASTRPISVLCLGGQEQDDPDLHPVQLTGKHLDPTKVKSKESPAWHQETSIAETLLISPSRNSASLECQGTTRSGGRCSTSSKCH